MTNEFMNQSTPQNTQSNLDRAAVQGQANFDQAAFVNAQAQRNMAQENRVNAQQHAAEAEQLRQQATTQQEVQYKVTSSFRDSQDNNKLYQVGQTYQCQDASRVQALLAAHVITEEVPQVKMQTSSLSQQQFNAARQQSAAKAEAATNAMSQEAHNAAQQSQGQNLSTAEKANLATKVSHAASKAQEQAAQTANQATANEAAAQQSQAKVKKVASKQGNE